ncbi:MAG: ATP cone domain-containing protein [Chloroflexi bacterium]|nr:ATP cone domain-containing protein [Chloroflexota bacterium]
MRLDHLTAEQPPVRVPAQIVKRDGRIVRFESSLIENALRKCFASLGRTPRTPIETIANQVVNVVAAKFDLPTVEGVQDIVEMVLQAGGEYEAAKAYILYRAEHAKLRQHRPIPQDVKDAFAESDAYFPTQLQKFQFYDKYSRFNYEKGRRETWVETVNRAVDFLRDLSGNKLDAAVYNRVRDGILHMKVMPSMRLLAMAGPAAERNHVAIYNCSYLPVDSIDSFVEALIISMSGCGVGYSVERQYVENMPRIKRQTGIKQPKHIVGDTSEGWADALRLGLETWMAGEDIEFDFSQVRPAGMPLKIKGGRASGPEPLRKMFHFARERILARQGGFMTTLDAHDIMCAVGSAAVSGGVRRTAMISLFDYDDMEMRHCKDGDFWLNNSQRWNANNSAVWPQRELNQQEIARFVLDMVESGRGEPGIFNRKAAIENRPARRKEADFGTNPCVTAETWVMTADGPAQVADLRGRAFTALVDGQAHPSTEAGFFATGRKAIYEIETEEGHLLRATADHPILQVTSQTRKKQTTAWTNVEDLRAGDSIRLHNQRGASWEADDHGAAVAWLLGLLVGDGTFARHEAKSNQAILRFWGQPSEMMAEMAHGILTANIPTRSDLQPVYHPRNEYWQLASTGLNGVAEQYGLSADSKTITPALERTSSAFYSGFLRGLFDADGTVIGTQEKGVSVRLAQSNLETLQAVQRMLGRLGIVSTVYQNRREAGYKLLSDGRGGQKEYWTQDQHELVVSNDNLFVFQERVGFSDPNKAAKLGDKLAGYRRIPNQERFVARIKAITPVGLAEVYDCTVPVVHAFDANGLYVHNCGEIILRPYAFCNLTSVVARADDSLESLIDKVEMATILGTLQSMATHFPGLRPQWRENCAEERLLGVDLNGQMDSPMSQDPVVQARLREVAVETNRIYAEKLGINQSVAVTCVKPSGNSSQLLDSASGLHARWAPYYIRNVRVGAHSPVFKVLKDTAVPMDPENGQTPKDATTWVVHFPVRAPKTAVTRNDRTAIQQCEYWLQNKVHYTEHNPSVTITYRHDEVIDLLKWVWEHQDKIGGMAFLPAFDAQYDQMPYEEISAEEYEKLAAVFPAIDFAKIYRYEEEDLTTAAQELACLAGNCDV